MTSDSYYDQCIVRTYRYWTLLVEEKQRYLGQSVVWLNRDGDMQRLSSITAEERDELWNIVLPEFERAIDVISKPDHMNYTWLGNYFHLHKGHGHMHLIPRYASKREFAGVIFEDSRWGNNYVPYPNDGHGIEFAHKVRDAFLNHLSNSEMTSSRGSRGDTS